MCHLFANPVGDSEFKAETFSDDLSECQGPTESESEALFTLPLHRCRHLGQGMAARPRRL